MRSVSARAIAPSGPILLHESLENQRKKEGEVKLKIVAFSQNDKKNQPHALQSGDNGVGAQGMAEGNEVSIEQLSTLNAVENEWVVNLQWTAKVRRGPCISYSQW